MSLCHVFSVWGFHIEDFQEFSFLAGSFLTLLSLRSRPMTSFHVFQGRNLRKSSLTLKVLYIYWTTYSPSFFLNDQAILVFYHINIPSYLQFYPTPMFLSKNSIFTFKILHPLNHPCIIPLLSDHIFLFSCQSVASIYHNATYTFRYNLFFHPKDQPLRLTKELNLWNYSILSRSLL